MSEKAEKKLWGKYHELGLLLLGFALTTILGSALAFWLQNRQWEAQSAWNLRQTEIDRASKVYDEVSVAMGRRWFQSLRYTGSLEEKEDAESQKAKLKAYNNAVAEWNEHLTRHIALLQRYFGKEISNVFEYQIHGTFRLVQQTITGNEPDFAKAHQHLDSLGFLIYSANFAMIRHLQAGSVGVFNPDLVAAPTRTK